ncbi:MAG: primosomal protein N' [Calditrichia bacterium]
MSEYATVILTIPDNNGFTYRVPREFQEMIQPGMQVIIPFGKRKTTGIVLEISDCLPASLRGETIREISDVVFDQPVVTPDLIALLKWISDYYICHLGEAYRLVQSHLNVQNARLKIQRMIEDLPEPLTGVQREILNQLKPGKAVNFTTLKRKISRESLKSQLKNMEKQGWIGVWYESPQKRQILKTRELFRLRSPEELETEAQHLLEKILQGRPTKKKALVEFLRGKEWISAETLKQQGFSPRILKNLIDDRLVEIKSRTVDRTFDPAYAEPFEEIELTDKQLEFLEKVHPYVEKREFRPFLLHGITGSGKTQIYIELIQKVLERGRQSIVLIPEIVLTPQTFARFHHYFGDKVCVLHSRLSSAEKREIHYQIRRGKYQIVIGPRSALFAPVENLGLIVVDEEHENSYKQTDAQPRYHARDVAVYRARLNQAVVVLGSATPSFESLHNAETGLFEYFHIPRRVSERNLPRLSLVDLKEEWKKSGQPPILSDTLELKIESRLITREQVMILLNRRGYAPYLLCKECGYVAKCTQCDISLTYHFTKKRMMCHYCGYNEKAPDVCPNCQGIDILYKGIGTQRIEEVFQEKFPHAVILRMDRDTTGGKHGHLKILEQFRSGNGDILFGTQMIAKGLDFRRVSLVGIISADHGLHFPDFRSSEKVFQLLTQAAGRAGRGAEGGEVIVQTYDPSHYIFKYLFTHDYLQFYKKESESRKMLNYPPFSRLMLIRIEGENQKAVEAYAAQIAKFLWKANAERTFSILGPAPAPLSRIRKMYRYHILIKQDKSRDPSMNRVRHVVKQGLYLNNELKKWPVKVVIDMDPVDIL